MGREAHHRLTPVKPRDAADTLALQIRMAGFAPAEREYRFAAIAAGGTGKGVRERLARARLQDWRFDVAWPEPKVAVEVDGGGFTQGRHSRGAGMESDCAKLSTAVAMGWRVLRVTPAQVTDGRALTWIEQTLGGVEQ